MPFNTKREEMLYQDFIPNLPRTITVHHCTTATARDEIRHLLEDLPKAVGVAAHLTSKGGLHAVTFASPRQVLCVSIRGPAIQNFGSSSSSPLAQLLTGRAYGKAILAGFRMPYLALFISRHMGIPVKGVDLPTIFAANPREQKSPSNLVRLKVCPNGKVDQFKIDGLWDVAKDEDIHALCFRAWISACIAHNSIEEIRAAIKVDTVCLKEEELNCLAQVAAEVHHLRSLRPTTMQNDFVEVTHGAEGYQVENARYKTRLRSSFRTHIEITTADGQTIKGRAVHVEGRQTRIKPQGNYSGTVERIRVIGRQELNSAEKAFDEFLLFITQGRDELKKSILISIIWFPALYHLNERDDDSFYVFPRVASQLNTSQQNVVQDMINDMPPVVVSHGPPGTGKTTTISAAVAHWSDGNEPVWIIAQSNVAVKNIAESLAKRNVEFRLIVSKEFHFEWHEHIYEMVQDWVIRSDDIPTQPLDVERLLGGSCVVLCTLSMLSNPILEERRLFDLIPLERLVVDEASQINVSDFMPILHRFRGDLFKICFFGDPNQLPPYGQDQVPLKSVFEVERLRRSANFLDVQYRLPVPLGAFLSKHMYGSKLRSVHPIEDMSCIRFVNVFNGEEGKLGMSSINMEEVHTIVRLVRYYYWNKDFVIVTPYDAQRAQIERRLKAEDLPWETVFNVDSFQGNEKPYVLVSLVRTNVPGFLSSNKRANVMLSRCQRGMVIVTNRQFLRTSGQDTLMAKLAYHWEARIGEEAWVDWGSVANGTAHLPGVGVAAPRRPAGGLSAPRPGQPFSVSFTRNDLVSPSRTTAHPPSTGITRTPFQPRFAPQPAASVERPALDPEKHFPPLRGSTASYAYVATQWPKLQNSFVQPAPHQAQSAHASAGAYAGRPGQRQNENVVHSSFGRNSEYPAMSSPDRNPVHTTKADPWVPWIIKQKQQKQQQKQAASAKTRKTKSAGRAADASWVAKAPAAAPSISVKIVYSNQSVTISDSKGYSGDAKRVSNLAKSSNKKSAVTNEGPRVEHVSPRVLRILNGTSFTPPKVRTHGVR